MEKEKQFRTEKNNRLEHQNHRCGDVSYDYCIHRREQFFFSHIDFDCRLYLIPIQIIRRMFDMKYRLTIIDIRFVQKYIIVSVCKSYAICVYEQNILQAHKTRST